MQRLWLDLETYSETPISYGTHAYGATAEIMLFAWAIDDGPAQVWDRTSDDWMPDELHRAINLDHVEVWAHNSQFDRTMLEYAGWKIPIYRWRDTMIQAMSHSLPGSLAQLCEIMRVDTDKAKDADGKRLIQLFCKPRPQTSKIRRATRETHPAEWARFVEYARLDIEAMREINRKLPTWNYP